MTEQCLSDCVKASSSRTPAWGRVWPDQHWYLYCHQIQWTLRVSHWCVHGSDIVSIRCFIRHRVKGTSPSIALVQVEYKLQTFTAAVCCNL